MSQAPVPQEGCSLGDMLACFTEGSQKTHLFAHSGTASWNLPFKRKTCFWRPQIVCQECLKTNKPKES